MGDPRVQDLRDRLRQIQQQRDALQPQEEACRALESSVTAALKALVIERLGELLPPLPPNYGDPLESDLDRLCWLLMGRLCRWEEAQR